MHSHYPILDLVSSENCDYAYNQVDSLARQYDKKYEKYGRPYDEVIVHFVTLANKQKQLLLFSKQEGMTHYNGHYPSLCRYTTYRFLPEFPPESILQISNRLLSGMSE